MTVVVIDGYNLIRRVAELREIEHKDGLEAGRAALELRLAGYGARPGVRVLIVYDGVPGPVSRAAGLSVLFSDRADATVVELALKHASNGEQVRAVSSDRAGVGAPLAGANRVEVVSAEQFWESALAGKSRKHKTGKGEGVSAGSDKPQRVSRDEVRYWLGEFGGAERNELPKISRRSKEQKESIRKNEEKEAKSQLGLFQDSTGPSKDEQLKARRRERHLKRQSRKK